MLNGSSQNYEAPPAHLLSCVAAISKYRLEDEHGDNVEYLTAHYGSRVERTISIVMKDNSWLYMVS